MWIQLYKTASINKRFISPRWPSITILHALPRERKETGHSSTHVEGRTTHSRDPSVGLGPMSSRLTSSSDARTTTARDVEVAAGRGLVGGAVALVGVAGRELVQTRRGQRARDGVAGHAVRRQVGRLLGDLVGVLGLRKVRHEALVLAVEIDEHESRQHESAAHAVAAERRSSPCGQTGKVTTSETISE